MRKRVYVQNHYEKLAQIHRPAFHRRSIHRHCRRDLWGYQLPLIAFISALILMTFTTDYRRVSSLTFESSLPNAILTPANKAFSAATPGHRVAAPRRIRRVRHQLVRN
jgi:hypothetical protein